MAALATMAMVRRQLQRLGTGKSVQRSPSPLFTLIRDQLRLKRLTVRYRRWLTRQNEAQVHSDVVTQA